MTQEAREAFERVAFVRGAALLGEYAERLLTAENPSVYEARAVMSNSREALDRVLATLGVQGEIQVDPHVAGRTVPDRTFVPYRGDLAPSAGLKARSGVMERDAIVLEVGYWLHAKLMKTRRRMLVITVKVDGEAFYHESYTYAYILHSQERVENLLVDVVSAYYRDVLHKEMPKPPAVVRDAERDELVVREDVKDFLRALDSVEGVTPMLPIERISADLHAMVRRLEDLGVRFGRMEAALVHLSDQMTGIEHALNVRGDE